MCLKCSKLYKIVSPVNGKLMSAFNGVDSTHLVKRVLQQPKTQMSVHAFSVFFVEGPFYAPCNCEVHKDIEYGCYQDG